MKTFINRQTSITMSVADTNEKILMTYVDLALLTLNIPPHGGLWTRKEQKLRFKIEDKLDGLEVDATLKLEDAEFEKILELALQPWRMKHRDVLRYMDDLEEWNKEE